MTSIPIVDTHMHLWDPEYLSYAWLEEVQVLNRPFLLADYQRAMDSHQVAKMVFVQCEADQDQYVQEAEWVLVGRACCGVPDVHHADVH